MVIYIGFRFLKGFKTKQEVGIYQNLCCQLILPYFVNQDDSVKQTARLMYQTALFESGFLLDDPKDFASRVYDSVKTSLSISPDATVEEEDDAEEVESETKDDSSSKAEAEVDGVKDEL